MKECKSVMNVAIHKIAMHIIIIFLTVIAKKKAEGNYEQLSEDVGLLLKDYNELLCHSLSAVGKNSYSSTQ